MNGNKIEYWEQRFYREFVSKPGQHMGVVGRTGAGKTNYMKWSLQAELEHRRTVPMKHWNTIVWFDIGKASEILGICCGMRVPCRLIIPDDMDIHVELFEPDTTYYEVEKVYVSNEREIWQNLSRDRVNIVCFEGFIRDIDRMVVFIKKTFSSLIDLALDYKLKNITPMRIYYDEFHNIAPSKGNAASADIFKHGGDIQLNIEKLRGHGIGFVAGLHKWTELRPGIRSSFMFMACMTGANFPGQEQPKLYRFNRKFEKLQPGQVMIAFPGKTLSMVMNLPLLPEGKEYGYLYYRGRLAKPEKKKTHVQKHESEFKGFGETARKFLSQGQQVGGAS